MPVFKTEFHGYSVKFSPFLENRLAVSTSQNYGIVGNGKQYILDNTFEGLREVICFYTADGIYDCAWSEMNENILVSACGDGTVKVWDLGIPPQANPVRNFEEHKHEVHSVDWNNVRKDSFLSASWDDSIKLWTLEQPNSLRTFGEHNYCVYYVVWNPSHGDVFASASGDSTLKIWDLREVRSVLTVPAHDNEVLCCDWNKYNNFVIATGSVDKTIKLWDVRNPRMELTCLRGHNYAVRRIKFSPHNENVLASCSYDMSLCFWDAAAPEDCLLNRYEHHTEFVFGLDLSVLVEGLVASASWDETVFVWPYGMDPRAA